MSGYTDMAKLESSRNCLRRIARHDEQQFSKDSLVNIMEKFVKTVNIMDETILIPCRLMDRQVGDSTDIIPVKLHQNQHGRKNHFTSVGDFLNSADLFNLYNMLNAFKNDLLWTCSDSDNTNIDLENFSNSCINSNSSGRNDISTSTLSTQNSPTDQCSDVDAFADQRKLTNINNTLMEPSKTHTRRPSTVSMASLNSISNLSDSESDFSNENDSGIESEGIVNQENKTVNSKTDKATELARQCRMHLAGLYKCLGQMTEAANYITARYQSDIGSV